MKFKLFNPILLYHSTFKEIPKSLQGNIHNVEPEILIKQITWLKKYFDIVSLEELYSSKRIFGKFAITFDDAYESVFDEVLPCLISMKIPVTIFINSSSFMGKIFWRDRIRYLISNKLVDNFINRNNSFCKKNKINSKNFYSRTKHIEVDSKHLSDLLDEFFKNNISNLKANKNFLVTKTESLIKSKYIAYGNHTMSHLLLSSISKQNQIEEIKGCHDFLNNSCKLKNRSEIFSVPFGGLDSLDKDTVEILNNLNYKGILLSRSRVNNVFSSNFDKDLGIYRLERFMPVNDFRLFKKQFVSLCVRSIFNKNL